MSGVREASGEELAALFAGLDPGEVDVAVCDQRCGAAIAAAADAFDCEMLRMRIAKVLQSRAPSTAVFEQLYAYLAGRLRRAGFEQVIRRLRIEDRAEIWALGRVGFEMVDVGLVFGRRLIRPTAARQDDELLVRAATVEDLHQFAPEMLRQPWGSRYESDPAYRRADVRRLRKHWLHNSLAGRADVFLVGQLGSRVAGYATGRLHADGRRGSIELLGTLPAFRRRGVALRILEHMISWFSTRAELLTVRTQAANYPAANLYEKAGFLLLESDMTFRLALSGKKRTSS